MAYKSGGWKVMLRPITLSCLSLDFNWIDSPAKLDLHCTFRKVTTALVRSVSMRFDR
jgi:hypothetical protein